MQKDNITIGDRIELTQTKSTLNRKLSDNKYASQLLDYDGIRTFKISVPLFEGRVVPLDVGDEYQLCFFTSKGMYRCRAKVIRRYMEMKIHILEMRMITGLTKFQRRQFFRLDCFLDFQYRIISEEEKALRDLIDRNEFSDEAVRANFEKKLIDMNHEWNEAKISDISGGGIRFQCTGEIKQQMTLEFKLPLKENNRIQMIQCMASVIEVFPGMGQNQESTVRCQFEGLDKQTQEKIIKYIFEEQKRRIRKD